MKRKKAAVRVAELMTTDELAAYLRVTPRTIKRWAKEEGLPHYRHSWSKTRLFVHQEVLAWGTR